jgi:peroxiredoxin Q/BCP
MLGQPVEDFSLPSTGATTFRLSGVRGRTLVLYFYPKDNTPGCTAEGVDFRDRYDAFRAAGCEVVGVSRDAIKSHENFKAKMAFPFALLADRAEDLCNRFGVIKMKNLYGKQVRGIERSTFVIDAHGVLVHEWRGVKVPGHVEEVLRFVQAR